jgi:beta-aspartyl-peptidase (threonine type)
MKPTSRSVFASLLGVTLVSTICSAAAPVAAPAPTKPRPFGIVIHGGAGVIERKTMTPEVEAAYRTALSQAREAGYAVLDHDGSSLDAVVAAIKILEDSPLFNAGKGAVMTVDGLCELDASIMDGKTQSAGAVAGLRQIKNPITLARAVMEKSDHVMLAGAGAEKFALEQKFELVPNEYFQTEFRRKQLEKAKQREAGRPTSQLGTPSSSRSSLDQLDHFDRTAHYGTVGCVALDKQGNLAAGTSTGGMTNKKFGRIGDAPIIGAGTYANNDTCAVSATGWGEYFIRVGVARDIAAQMEYKGSSVADAATASISKVGALGGDGGVICIDRNGNIAMPFNSLGMYRGYKLSTGAAEIEIFGPK